MDIYSRMLRDLKTPETMERFARLYGRREGELARQLTRYTELVKTHEDLFHGQKPLYLISAPGRTEIAGNHTDHQNGCVLAGSINLDTLAAVCGRDDNRVVVYSEGFPKVEIMLDDLSVHQEEMGTSAGLIRGIAAGMQAHQFKIGGFEAALTSDVLSGSGLSSSAAYEVLICAIFDALYNGLSVDPILRAQIGQYAENVYFGKPCGLMDQMACSVGGMVAIDFKNEPVVQPVSFGFADAGYAIIVVNTRGSHDDLTDEYAAIRSEMNEVAALFGEKVLRRVRPEQILNNLGLIRTKISDRAALRAIHFIKENERAKQQLNNIRRNDLGAFFTLINESGMSSWTLLQNIYVPGTSQPLALALAMAGDMLKDKGAWRVHGGGFAGTTLNFVPNDMVDEFVSRMNGVFGDDSCYVLDIRPEGAAVVIHG